LFRVELIRGKFSDNEFYRLSQDIDHEFDRLSQDIDPATDTPLYYYPLTKKGERFPVSESNKELSVLQPVPDNRRDLLHDILQGIGDV
jgi:hypothetical protein